MTSITTNTAAEVSFRLRALSVSVPVPVFLFLYYPGHPVIETYEERNQRNQ